MLSSWRTRRFGRTRCSAGHSSRLSQLADERLAASGAANPSSPSRRRRRERQGDVNEATHALVWRCGTCRGWLEMEVLDGMQRKSTSSMKARIAEKLPVDEARQIAMCACKRKR